ncbi:hypothetical protein OAV01_03520 [Opitutales bacterium]|nr:hypothetical protein [Opitutales bacterium]
MRIFYLFSFTLLSGSFLSFAEKSGKGVAHKLGESIKFDWTKPIPIPSPITLSVSVKGGGPAQDSGGFGVVGNDSNQVNSGEALAIRFQQDVQVDSLSLDIGETGKQGGFIRMGSKPPVQISSSSKNRVIKIDKLGLLKRGEMLILDSSAFKKGLSGGSWKLVGLTARAYPQEN